jgi:hypothetical protein
MSKPIREALIDFDTGGYLCSVCKVPMKSFKHHFYITGVIPSPGIELMRVETLVCGKCYNLDQENSKEIRSWK